MGSRWHEHDVRDMPPYLGVVAALGTPYIWVWWLGNLYGYGWMPGFVIMFIGNSLYGVTMTWTWCQRYDSIFGRGGRIWNIGNSSYGVTMTWTWCQRYASIFGRGGCIWNIGNSLYGVTMTWTWCQRYASIFGRGGCIGNLYGYGWITMTWAWCQSYIRTWCQKCDPLMSSLWRHHCDFMTSCWCQTDRLSIKDWLLMSENVTDWRTKFPISTVTCDLRSQ